MSAMHAKDAAARRLIEWHFTVEPELCEVYRILMENEGSREEPIRLLEVNAATVPTGSVEPFAFSPTQEIPFRTVIAEITPEELDSLRLHPETLPEGWSFSRAERFVRPNSPVRGDSV
jgi:hypothetical protein